MYQILFGFCLGILAWEALAPLEDRGHYRDRFNNLYSFLHDLTTWAWKRGKPHAEEAIEVAKAKIEASSIYRSVGRLIGEVQQFNIKEEVVEDIPSEEVLPGRLIAVKPKRSKAIV